MKIDVDVDQLREGLLDRARGVQPAWAFRPPCST